MPLLHNYFTILQMRVRRARFSQGPCTGPLRLRWCRRVGSGGRGRAVLPSRGPASGLSPAGPYASGPWWAAGPSSYPLRDDREQGYPRVSVHIHARDVSEPGQGPLFKVGGARSYACHSCEPCLCDVTFPLLSEFDVVVAVVVVVVVKSAWKAMRQTIRRAQYEWKEKQIKICCKRVHNGTPKTCIRHSETDG